MTTSVSHNISHQPLSATLDTNIYEQEEGLSSRVSYPPPTTDPQSEWKTSEIDQENARLQKIIFADIIQPKWQGFRSREKTIAQLEEAGFVKIQIFPD